MVDRVEHSQMGRVPSRSAATALLLLATGLIGCTTVIPAEPTLAPPPTLEPAALGEGVSLRDPEPPLTRPEEGERDEILHSRWAMHPDIDERVNAWLGYWRGVGAEEFAQYLNRMGRYRDLVSAEVRDQELPPSLIYLPVIESGYKPTAVSRASAVGLWQFMATTARGFGLEVGGLIDERRDPYLATPRALQFLAELRERYGSWFLVLAAYNSGPNRVERLLNRYAPGATPSDSLYIVIRPYLPRETREFIPKFLAASRLAARPEWYGFDSLEPDEPIDFDSVSVPYATSMDVLARVAETPQEVMEVLNPQLVRGLTPARRTTSVRVPRGKAGLFSLNYRALPPEERVTFLEHRVRQGETLSHIAVMYGVRVRDLRAANPDIRPRRMRIGENVIIPRAPSVRASRRGR